MREVRSWLHAPLTIDKVRGHLHGYSRSTTRDLTHEKLPQMPLEGS